MDKSYSKKYLKLVKKKIQVTPKQMTRAKFYLLKNYEYVTGEVGSFSDADAPIIFSIFVSPQNDIVHAVLLSGVDLNIAKRFFSKFSNKETNLLEMKQGAKQFYSSAVAKIPKITSEAYRTYKLSGIKKVYELNMNIDKLTPASMKITGIDNKSQVKNK